jgi:hypothetical protein
MSALTASCSIPVPAQTDVTPLFTLFHALLTTKQYAAYCYCPRPCPMTHSSHLHTGCSGLWLQSNSNCRRAGGGSRCSRAAAAAEAAAAAARGDASEAQQRCSSSGAAAAAAELGGGCSSRTGEMLFPRLLYYITAGDSFSFP